MLPIAPYVAHAKRQAVVAANKRPTLVSKADLQRMRATAQPEALAPPPPAKPRDAASTLLAKLSVEEERRFRRFEAEELLRVKEDEAFEATRIEQAAAKCAAAGEQMFLRQERIQALHSSLAYSDALAERQRQMELRERQRDRERCREAAEDLEQQKLLVAADAQRHAELTRIASEKTRLQSALREQMRQVREGHRSRLHEEQLEGQLRRLKAEEALFAEQARQEEARRAAAESKRQTLERNQQHSELQKKLRAEEQEEERRLIKLADELSEQREKRREAEIALREQKQAQRQNALALHGKNLSDFRSSKSAQAQSQPVTPFTDSLGAEGRKHAARAVNLRQNCLTHIDQTLSEKAVLSAATEAENRRFQEFWTQRNADLSELEASERAETRALVTKVAKYNSSMAQAKNDQLIAAAQRELAESEAMKENMREKDRQYASYAERCLRQWESDGKNVLPVLLELKKQKETILAAFKA